MTTISENEGLLELSILNAEFQHENFNDVVVELANKDVPMEVITRLKDLWEKTKVIAGEVVNVGKIIVTKIIEFIKSNPNMAIGIAIGAAIGLLVGVVPFFGPLLQPITLVLGVALGVFVGHQMDKNKPTTFKLMESAIETARIFFQLFVDIFISVKTYFEAKSEI